jgi:hypothetical protein
MGKKDLETEVRYLYFLVKNKLIYDKNAPPAWPSRHWVTRKTLYALYRKVLESIKPGFLPCDY